MKQSTNIHISGRIFSIEKDALSVLEAYLTKLKNFFSAQESGDEIYEDIEVHVADILEKKMNVSKSKICLSIEDIESTIQTVGQPSEFDVYDDAADDTEAQAKTSSKSTSKKELKKSITNRKIEGVAGGMGEYFGIDPTWIRLSFIYATFLGGIGLLAYIILAIILPRSKSTYDANTYKQFYRVSENAMLGGVCTGLSVYLSTPTYVIRLLFVLPLLLLWVFDIRVIEVASNPLGVIMFFTYLLIWALVPVAKRSTDKLRMKGIKTTIDNIRKETKANLSQPRSTFSSIAKVIGYIALGIGLLVVGGVLLAVFIVLIVICIAPFIFSTLFEHGIQFLDYVFIDGWHTYAVLIAAFVVIIVPLLFLVTYFTSLLFRKPISGYIYLGAFAVWLMALILLGSIGVYTGSQFDQRATYVKRIALSNIDENLLHLRIQENTTSQEHLFRMFIDDDEDHIPWSISQDKFYWENVELEIVEGNSSEFILVQEVTARGSSSRQAKAAAKQVNFSFNLNTDTLTIMPQGWIVKGSPFRMQRIKLILEIPPSYAIKTANYTAPFQENIEANVTYTHEGGMLKKYYHF